MRIVPTDGVGLGDVQEITIRIHARLRPEVRVDVETVGSIPRTPAGKYQAVVSKASR